MDFAASEGQGQLIPSSPSHILFQPNQIINKHHHHPRLTIINSKNQKQPNNNNSLPNHDQANHKPEFSNNHDDNNTLNNNHGSMLIPRLPRLITNFSMNNENDREDDRILILEENPQHPSTHTNHTNHTYPYHNHDVNRNNNYDNPVTEEEDNNTYDDQLHEDDNNQNNQNNNLHNHIHIISPNITNNNRNSPSPLDNKVLVPLHAFPSRFYMHVYINFYKTIFHNYSRPQIVTPVLINMNHIQMHNNHNNTINNTLREEINPNHSEDNNNSSLFNNAHKKLLNHVPVISNKLLHKFGYSKVWVVIRSLYMCFHIIVMGILQMDIVVNNYTIPLLILLNLAFVVLRLVRTDLRIFYYVLYEWDVLILLFNAFLYSLFGVIGHIPLHGFTWSFFYFWPWLTSLASVIITDTSVNEPPLAKLFLFFMGVLQSGRVLIQSLVGSAEDVPVPICFIYCTDSASLSYMAVSQMFLIMAKYIVVVIKTYLYNKRAFISLSSGIRLRWISTHHQLTINNTNPAQSSTIITHIASIPIKIAPIHSYIMNRKTNNITHKNQVAVNNNNDNLEANNNNNNNNNNHNNPALPPIHPNPNGNRRHSFVNRNLSVYNREIEDLRVPGHCILNECERCSYVIQAMLVHNRSFLSEYFKLDNIYDQALNNNDSSSINVEDDNNLNKIVQWKYRSMLFVIPLLPHPIKLKVYHSIWLFNRGIFFKIIFWLFILFFPIIQGLPASALNEDYFIFLSILVLLLSLLVFLVKFFACVDTRLFNSLIFYLNFILLLKDLLLFSIFGAWSIVASNAINNNFIVFVLIVYYITFKSFILLFDAMPSINRITKIIIVLISLVNSIRLFVESITDNSLILLSHNSSICIIYCTTTYALALSSIFQESMNYIRILYNLFQKNASCGILTTIIA